MKQKNCAIENQILQEISHIKNITNKSPTGEHFLNHISKPCVSNFDFSFVSEIVCWWWFDDNFIIVEEVEHGNPDKSIDEVVQILFIDKLSKILDRGPTTPQLVDEKDLKILTMTTLAP